MRFPGSRRGGASEVLASRELCTAEQLQEARENTLSPAQSGTGLKPALLLPGTKRDGDPQAELPELWVMKLPLAKWELLH